MDESVSIHVNAKLYGIVFIFYVIDSMWVSNYFALKSFHVIVMHGFLDCVGLISNKLSLFLFSTISLCLCLYYYCGDIEF